MFFNVALPFPFRMLIFCILHYSVAMFLRDEGISSDNFVANFVLSPALKYF